MKNQKFMLGIGLGLIIVVAIIVSLIPKEGQKEDTADTKQSVPANSNNKYNVSNTNTDTLRPKVPTNDLDDVSTIRRQPLNTIPFSQSDNKLRNDPEKWFEDATYLAESGHSEEQYIEFVLGLLKEYIIITKQGGYPTGLNVEITNALLGDNTKKIAIIPQDHPRINDLGQLVDSWGTPYFFHNESLQEIKIRSAGPDKKFYTDDDTER